MGELKIGDIVARKSYGLDVFFKVVDIKQKGGENIVTLQGISYRIEADAPESDLIVQSDQRIREHYMRCEKIIDKKIKESHLISSRGYSKKAFNRDTSKDNVCIFARPGKVLHLDGDIDYLQKSIYTCIKSGFDLSESYIC